MRFTVDRSVLMTGLQRVYAVVPVRSTVPVLTNILLTASDGGLEIMGTDLEVSVRTLVPLDVEESGALAIPARLFYEVVRELPDVPIEFSMTGLELEVKTEHGRYRFPGLPKEDFPTIHVETDANGLEISTDILTRMVNKTIFAVSTDPLRLALTGVLFNFLDDSLELIATDGHRLVRVRRKNLESGIGPAQAILPTKSLNILLRNVDASRSIRLQLSENHMVFRLADTVIYSKLVAAKYPNYDGVIPKENEYELVLVKDELAAAVRRVAVFASTMSKAVRFDLQSKTLKVSAEDVDYGGEGEEEITVEYDGPPMEVAYNGQYLLDILRHIDTSQAIFKLHDNQTGALVFPSEQMENEDLMMLIMPIRLTQGEEGYA